MHQAEVQFTNTRNSTCFTARSVGKPGRGGIPRGDSEFFRRTLPYAIIWASLWSAVGADQTPRVQAEARDLTNHAWLKKVGQLTTHTEIATLTLEINITNIVQLLTRTLKQQRGRSEHRIVEKWIEEIKDSSIFLQEQGREKRDILTWLASITGLFNHLHISKINKEISSLYKASHSINNQTNNLFHHIKTDEQNLRILANATKINDAKLKDIDLRQNKREIWISVRRTMSALRNLIELLPQHRLTHDAIFLFDLEKEWQILEHKAQQKGRKLVATTWHFLLQAHTSFWANKEGIFIALEIPVTTQKTATFDLFHLQPTKFLINNKIFTAQTRQKFLAVHVQTQTTIALDQHQMDTQTTQVGQTWYLHGPATVNHGDERECIEALWTGDLNEVEQWCYLTATRNKELALPVNNTSVFWITNEPITITIQCTNQPNRVHTITNPTLLHVDPDCEANSNRLTFLPSPVTHFRQETWLKTFKGKSNASTEQFPSWKLQQPEQLTSNFHAIDTILNQRFHLIPIWLSISIAIFTLIAVTGFMIWLYFKAKRQLSPSINMDTLESKS